MGLSEFFSTDSEHPGFVECGLLGVWNQSRMVIIGAVPNLAGGGGSLIFNIVTIFDPAERFRRDRGNENDGGLLRHVCESGGLPRERGRIVAFENVSPSTYAAADITTGYSSNKVREVAREVGAVMG